MARYIIGSLRSGSICCLDLDIFGNNENAVPNNFLNPDWF